MKRIEKLAVVAVVLLVVCRIAPIFSNWLLTKFCGPSLTSGISMLQRLSAAGMLPVVLLVNIAIGVWLYLEARRDRLTPCVWFLFGLLFQLPAVAVFYLVRIHNLLKTQHGTTSEQHVRQVSSEAAPSASPDEPST